MMTAKIQSDFLPLFGAWFDTANLAQSAGAQALASYPSGEGRLVRLSPSAILDS